MKQFTALAVTAAAVAAEYMPWTVNYDGADQTMHVRSQNFSVAEANGNSLYIDDNNNIFMQAEPYDGADYAFKPELRGGMIEYDIDMSWNDCGCVSSLYLVANDNLFCPQGQQANDDVNCPTIDVMQGNNYGFNVGANPCTNGTCDAVSQCMYDMRTEGAAEYGEGAYGPGGSLINTYGQFHVKTEFLATEDYETLWGMRTRITQGENEIVMMKECQDYLGELSDFIEGGMSLVFSSWDNRDGRAADFENGQCTQPQPDCDQAYSTFSNVRIQSFGYNEDPTPPGPEPPTPEPATFEGFIAYTDQSGYAPEWEMFVKGLDGRSLSTDQTSLTMGFDNKAFVLDYPYDDQTYWAYWHDLLGGSFSYSVDVSNVDCACAAGAFFVDLNDEACSWGAHPEGVTPQCPSIEIMEANIYGFNVASNPCDFGTCDVESQCKASVTTDAESTSTSAPYGPGLDFYIDTNMGYQVTTKFWASQDANGEAKDLQYIETILEQEGRTVKIVMDCPDYINSLSWRLVNNMNLGISTYALDLSNDVSGGTCDQVCSETTSLTMKDLTWSSGDSMLEFEEGELVSGGPAPMLDSGNCGSDCTECREFWYENTPNDIMYECVDRTEYKFGGKCKSSASKDSCMTDEDYCIISWDINDADKARSPLAKCRSVPSWYKIEDQADWRFARKATNNQTAGLCQYGCGAGTCHVSWPLNDSLRGKSVYAMARCKN